MATRPLSESKSALRPVNRATRLGPVQIKTPPNRISAIKTKVGKLFCSELEIHQRCQASAPTKNKTIPARDPLTIMAQKITQSDSIQTHQFLRACYHPCSPVA